MTSNLILSNLGAFSLTNKCAASAILRCLPAVTAASGPPKALDARVFTLGKHQRFALQRHDVYFPRRACASCAPEFGSPVFAEMYRPRPRPARRFGRCSRKERGLKKAVDGGEGFAVFAAGAQFFHGGEVLGRAVTLMRGKTVTRVKRVQRGHVAVTDHLGHNAGRGDIEGFCVPVYDGALAQRKIGNGVRAVHQRHRALNGEKFLAGRGAWPET